MISLDIALLQALFFLLLLIIADVVLGVAIALRCGKFSMAEVPRFLQTEVLPYYLGLLAIAALAMFEDTQQLGAKPLAWCVIVTYAARTVFVEIRLKVVKLFKIAPEKLPDIEVNNKTQSD